MSGFRVQGSGFRVEGLEFRVQGSGFRVQGTGCRVQGAGCRVQGPRPPSQIATNPSRINGANSCHDLFLLKVDIISVYPDYLALLIYYWPARPVIGAGYIAGLPPCIWLCCNNTGVPRQNFGVPCQPSSRLSLSPSISTSLSLSLSRSLSLDLLSLGEEGGG